VNAAPTWVAAVRAQAQRPPRVPRLPLWVAGQAVGSVEPGILDQIASKGLLDKRYKLLKDEQSGWSLHALGDATPALNALAQALRAQGRCGPWRNEQLAVCDAQGRRIGTIERGAVRPLGLATQAVHLVARAPDGRMWVQLRAFNKPNNPGQWDTLMGGMVSAADTLQTAVARETWEEAGLRMAQLSGLRPGGQVRFALPSDEGGGAGYMVECIHWYQATVRAGATPDNQDGEVERFDCLAHGEVQARLAQGAFTPEAALVLAAFYGW